MRLNLRLTGIMLLQLDWHQLNLIYKSMTSVVGRARFERATIALKVLEFNVIYTLKTITYTTFKSVVRIL